MPVSTKVILSSHNFQETPPAAELHARAAAMREAGADIVKIATMANDISDAAVVLSLLQQMTGAACRVNQKTCVGVEQHCSWQCVRSAVGLLRSVTRSECASLQR